MAPRRRFHAEEDEDDDAMVEEDDDEDDEDDDEEDDEEIVDFTATKSKRLPAKSAALKAIELSKPVSGKYSADKVVHSHLFARMICGPKEFTITVDGNRTIKTYGPVGKTAAHERVEHDHVDASAANVYAKLLMDMKDLHGYTLKEKKVESATKKAAPQGKKTMQVDNEPDDDDDDAAQDSDCSEFAYLEYIDAKSNKFWSITVDGKSTTARWGKIDSKGQDQVKVHSSAAEAISFANKMTDSKISSGYKLIRGSRGGGGGSTQAKKPATKATTTATKATTTATKATTTTATKAKGKGGAALGNKTFAISGTLSLNRNEFRDLITANGGAFLSSVTKKVDFLITTESEIADATLKVTSARSSGIPLVSEDFVTDSISAGSLKDYTEYTLE